MWPSVNAYRNNYVFSISGYLKKIDTPKPIKNDILGTFFCEFRGTYYMPNEMLAKQYPDDVSYLLNNS